MSDLNSSEPYDEYRSHPDKKLARHTEGVTRRVVERSGLLIGRVASLVHDVGKINPFFQVKVNPQFPIPIRPPGTEAYSSHAYLSALTFLRIRRLKLLGLETTRQRYSIAVLAARHHGNLRNFNRAGVESDKISCEVNISLKDALSENEYRRAYEHILRFPDMPLAGFASHVLKTDIAFDEHPPLYEALSHLSLKATDALDFFMETQFAFACLIAADKRDASNNEDERRETNIGRLTAALSESLARPLAVDTEPLSQPEMELNEVRSRIREETLDSLNRGLDEGRRVFCLGAPTGAGKTLTLLAAANAILCRRNGVVDAKPELFGVLYCLPFLSITEQVEAVCLDLLPEDLILRADSSAHHPEIEKLMEDAENDPVKAKQLLREDFAELVFDCPLIITTFVQFFETLMSHRNATLLKLPNFARSVILIDEIQALPPRLYSFFAAYLDAFCRKFHSYAILSTATMPNLDLPEDKLLTPAAFFPDYKPPYPLVSPIHFSGTSFQRYIVEPQWKISSLEQLASAVRKEVETGQSVMVVLNTISDTRELYRLLNDSEASYDRELLNTRFIPLDRRKKIDRCKHLEKGRPLILITTQLIEAGVNIDFPTIYRDLCPLPSVVQAAGRCNRHNRLPLPGRVVLVDIKSPNGRSRSELIYLQDVDGWYLDITRRLIQRPLREDEFLAIQTEFFRNVKDNLIMGNHPGLRDTQARSNLMLCIRDAAFEDAGRFKLIQDEGEQFAFYIPTGDTDQAFTTLQDFAGELVRLKAQRDFDGLRLEKIRLEAHLRTMRLRTVQARVKAGEAHRLSPTDAVMGIHELGDVRNYTYATGLEVAEDANYF